MKNTIRNLYIIVAAALLFALATAKQTFATLSICDPSNTNVVYYLNGTNCWAQTNMDGLSSVITNSTLILSGDVYITNYPYSVSLAVHLPQQEEIWPMTEPPSGFGAFDYYNPQVGWGTMGPPDISFPILFIAPEPEHTFQVLYGLCWNSDSNVWMRVALGKYVPNSDE